MSAYADRTDQIAKLPKWAQQIIERQQQTIAGLRTELAMTLRPADLGDQMVFESWHYSDDPLPKDMALPPGQLKIQLGVDRYGRQHKIGVVVETDHCGRKCIRLTGMQGPMHILPVASNTITVTTLRETKED